MLVDNIPCSSNSQPSFLQSARVESLYESVLLNVLPLFLQSFAQSFTKTVFSETDYSQNFGIIVDRYLKDNPSIQLLIRENTKDIYTSGANNKKMPDFVFFSSEIGSDIKPLYNIEAKRLPTDKENGDREKEYVSGQNKKDSGGIERFKTESHGYKLAKSALLGYIEQNDFRHWYEKINSWISDLATIAPSVWNTNEQLKDLSIDSSENYSIARSSAVRKADRIDLFHLWIKIPSNPTTRN